MYKKVMLASLRLFNAVPVTGEKSELSRSTEALTRTVKNGYILQSNVPAFDPTLSLIESVIGISGEKANQSFHKSWAVIQNSSIEDLVLQQIIHYITTYGFEELGIYDKDTVYIPDEVLEVPELSENFSFTVIKGLTKEELLEEVMKLASSGIALSDQVLSDLMEIVEYGSYESAFVDAVQNKELKVRLYDFYETAPTNPVEFLRYIVYRLTDTTLLIKNEKLITQIKELKDNKLAHRVLSDLLEKAPDDLASIFLRFKPIFLALKTVSKNKTFFNQLRKKANKMHKPMQKDILNSVTSDIQNGTLVLANIMVALESVNIFRKIRLANSLLFRLNGSDSIVYKIRSGKAWVEEFEWNEKFNQLAQEVLDVVLTSITNDLEESVSGKTFYIPSNIHYAIPATEKQMIGNIPANSYVHAPKDMVFGVHWVNLDGHRIDLDLSLLSAGGKIGWDSAYRSSNRDILYSGDNTDAPAPNGASELFYVGETAVDEEPQLMLVNYYNFSSDHPVPVKIFVGTSDRGKISRNYVIDQNTLLATALTTVSEKQSFLGLLTSAEEGGVNFYFSMSNAGGDNSSREDEQTKQTRSYLASFATSALLLEDVLKLAGANIVDEVSEEGVEYVNLSPETLDKGTIINILSSN